MTARVDEFTNLDQVESNLRFELPEGRLLFVLSEGEERAGGSGTAKAS
jgi:hypothetical protein